MICTWHVAYRDGSELYEYMAESPLAVDGQVGWKHIDWPNVDSILFASERTQRQFTVRPALPGCRYRLTRRNAQSVMSGDAVAYIALVLEVATGQWPPNPADAVSTFYWFPDGSTHTCADPKCTLAQDYLNALLWGRPGSLPLTHNA